MEPFSIIRIMHFLFFSTFNPDAISSVTFYKSDFPSKYGGRLSSITDVRMREGNNLEYKGNGAVGLLASRLSFEGPVVKGKSSFILSGRYSYAGIVANTLYPLHTIFSSMNNFRKGNEISFYDLNAKFNSALNTKNHLFISGYSGQDHFYFKNFSDKYSLDWGNTSATIRWNHVFKSRFFSNTTLAFSNYSYSYHLLADVRDFLWQANMKNYQLKSDYDFQISNSMKLDFGIFSGYLITSPGEITPVDTTSVIQSFAIDKKHAFEIGTYAECKIKITKRLRLLMGTRFTSFSEMGPGTAFILSRDRREVTDSVIFGRREVIKNYNQIDPRLSMSYKLTSNSAVKFSYQRVHQNLHLLSNSSVGLPTDIWMSAGYDLLPGISDQVSLGYSHSFNHEKIEASVEMFYKKINNVIDFRDNADLFLNENISTQILTGDANALGSEFFIIKKYGKISWWISYTISKVTNYINGINNNQPYPPVYDKRHNLKLIFHYKLNDRWELSSSFSLVSGSNITIPEGSFQYYGASFNYYTQRNGYKVPAFHEVDLSLTIHNSKKAKWNSAWIFTVNNLYNRKNVFSIYVRQNKYDLERMQVKKLYLYGFLPSITYNFNF